MSKGAFLILAAIVLFVIVRCDMNYSVHRSGTNGAHTVSMPEPSR